MTKQGSPMSDTLDRKLVEKGVTGLIGTEDSPYNAGWNDAVRHVLMDLKTGAYSSFDAPVGDAVPCPITEPLLLFLADQITTADNGAAAERLAGNQYHEHGWARERVAFQIVLNWVNENKNTSQQAKKGDA